MHVSNPQPSLNKLSKKIYVSCFLRTGNSLLPVSDVTQPVSFLEDGRWTNPYFDCGGGDIWMVTYSSPFFGLSSDHKSVIFRYSRQLTLSLSTTNDFG